MAQQLINVGTVANDRTGDTWRAAMIKINDNETELFERVINKRKLINKLADFPAAVSGIITLAANTQYLLGDNVSLGTDRIVMSSNTSVAGIDSIVVTLTYTGTGDMFTILNTRNRINDLGISCTTGRVINFSDNTDSIFRMSDCSVVCDRFGLFNSSGAIGSTVRFTNVSPSTITTSGITIQGGWNTWLWEVSAANLAAGSFFDLGTATFDEFVTDTILIALSAGSTFLTGATGSANINVGGVGQIITTLSSGAGALLSGITIDDALWEFFHNDDISDTRPDALLSMQGNATATVIAISGTYVLVAGTWIVDSTSQFTGTTAGRATYNAGKDARLPITYSCSVEPVSGTNKVISIKVAINGVVVDNSKRSVKADSGSPLSITIPWQETFMTSNFVEVFVTNDTDTVNVLVSSAIGRIH